MLFLVTVCIYFICAFQIQAQTHNRKLNQFIPEVYELLDSKSGDLNQDGFTDYILICKSPNEMETEDAKRPLIILHGQSDGSLYEAVRNDNVVLCALCGGVWGDPYSAMAIKKNFFSVEHMGGSSDKWTRIITFKYNLEEGQYYLHKDAGEVWNSNKKAKPKMESYLKENWGSLLFEYYTNE